MNIDFIHQKVLHMTPSSLSVRERQLYRAEKMVMRQFLLMKLCYKISCNVRVKDMKKWMLGRRRFLEEFEEVVEVAEPRELLMAELVWTSARRLCLNQMEKELYAELKKEKHLSMLFKRTVTLEGLQMFLFTFHPGAEKHVSFYLDHLSDQLLYISSAGRGSPNPTVHLKLQQVFALLVGKVVDDALDFNFSEAEGLAVESRSSGLASALGNRAEAVSAHIGEQLAEAAGVCFCPNSSPSEAVLQHLCLSVALDMVRDLHPRFVQRSKKFFLFDFDESVSSRETATNAIQVMEHRAQRSHLLALRKHNENSMMRAVWRKKQAMIKRKLRQR